MVSTVEKKWVFSILKQINQQQPVRFKDILEQLEGISTKTLSERLKDLQRQDIIERKSYSEIPPRVEYILTIKGNELLDSIKPIQKWAEKWNEKW